VRVATLLGSVAVGAVLSVQLKLGAALLLALCYLPVALTDIGVSLAGWVALPFLAGLAYFNLAGKAAGVLVAAGWIGLVAQRRLNVSRTLSANRLAFTALGALAVWVTLSAFWAHSASATVSDLWHWYAVGLIFVIVASTAGTPRLARLVTIAFITGSVLSTLYGLMGGISGAEAADPSTYSGRVGGAIGDPNFLAAGIVPAIVLMAALLPSLANAPRRIRGFVWSATGIAFLVLVAGLIKSESRGGLVAFVVAVILSLFAFPRQRRWVVATVLILLAVSLAALAITPSALQRFSSAGNGSGRTDEWTVAVRVFSAHPLNGVGDANFVVVARDYTRRPETGLVGLVLLVAIAGACLRAGWLAAARFRALGEGALETLSRGIVVATLAMLTAAGFISAQVDQRLWALLALGPAMLVLSMTQSAERAKLVSMP
jgi:O-antigen ligase